MLLPELVTYLHYQGIASLGTDLFYGPMKEAYPDSVLIIQEYGGSADEPDMSEVHSHPSESFGKGIRLEFPHVQILCRGEKNDYDGPRTRAERARRAVTKILNQTLSSTFYLAVEPIQPPFRLRTDDNFREEIVFNVRVTKEPSPMGYSLIDIGFGSETGFVTPSVSDTYPTGVTYDKLIPGSEKLQIVNASLASYEWEASGRVDSAGARVKAALFDLDTDTMITGSEITFTTDDTVGSRQRSGDFTLALGTLNLGWKQTVNSTSIGGAVWGIRLLQPL